ncbi:MAG: NAD-dependent epimerase/dehydratase family protein [Alphaproteobacteria bacterium]
MNAAGRRALVTGATGYVGTHVVRRLLAEGWTVGIVARPSSPTAAFGPADAPVPVHRDDGDDGALSAFARNFRPGVLVHLAALYIAAPEERDRPALEAANIHFARRVGAATAGTGAHGIVAAASHLQMRGDSDDPVPAPHGLYAGTKQAGEDALAGIAAARGMTFTSLVLFDTYGPGDPRRKLFDQLAEAAVANTTLAMSPGGQCLDLVWIEDAAAAFVAAAARAASGEARGRERFAVGSEERPPLRDIVDRWRRAGGPTPAIDWGALPYRPHQPMMPWRGPRLPGWQPRVALDEGLARMATALRHRDGG